MFRSPHGLAPRPKNEADPTEPPPEVSVLLVRLLLAAGLAASLYWLGVAVLLGIGYVLKLPIGWMFVVIVVPLLLVPGALTFIAKRSRAPRWWMMLAILLTPAIAFAEFSLFILLASVVR